MVALKSERRVYMWRVVARATPQEADKVVTVAEIIGILKDAYTAGEAQIYLSDEGRVLPLDAPESDQDPKNRVYIADVAEDSNVITMLINRGDPYVADTAFID